ncbi:winged helix-turn-helix domain-containing protein [Rhizobium leguminosarum]|uniref:winged helix-turn-helix domain-containing protein n=1 Tax=Rhizobium TaxID=379 RepID=UPI0013EE96A3|nr:winged helix-turn-helix domain-containing protein [Rhizobium leguminosarum]
MIPDDRILLGDDGPIKLGSRALDILICLVSRRGEIVSQREIMDFAWPNSTVGDNSLRVQIKTLRAVLAEYDADSCIVSRSGRGYEFVSSSTTLRLPPSRERVASIKDLIGREALIDAVLEKFNAERLISLVGPGGIGKTAVATEIFRQIAKGYRQGAYWVDFSSIDGGELAAATLARSLGLPISEEDPTATIVGFLTGREAFIVFDTCEHVVAAAAILADAILKGTAKVDILVTSREALRIRNEWIKQVPPLSFPAASVDLADVRIADYSALRLFSARAAASGFALADTRQTIGYLAEICARLDGLPLALELAAARAGEFGVRELLHGLEDRFGLLSDGFRTSLPRHQTMRAALTWSYDLLTENEQRLLDRLSIFRASFSLAAALTVALGRGLDEAEILTSIGKLVQKSLLRAGQRIDTSAFRLLDTTRAFGLEHLKGSQDFEQTCRQHAQYCLDRFGSRPNVEKSATDLDLAELRGALEWSLGSSASHALYIDLVLVAAPMMFERSLIDECRRCVETAMGLLPVERANSVTAMKLHAALGGVFMNIEGGGERTSGAWLEVYRLSGKLGDVDHRLKSLWGLWVDTRNRGRYRAAFSVAKRFSRLARQARDPMIERNADRMMGISHFFIGDLDQARAFLERMLLTAGNDRMREIATFQFDQAITARCFLAQILWLQGHSGQAMTLAAKNVEDALDLNHAGSLSYALTEGACPIALSIGDLDAAERYIELVLTRTGVAGLDVWRTLAECFQALVMLRHGNSRGFAALYGSLSAMRVHRLGPLLTRALADYASELLQAGRVEEAGTTIREAISRAETNGEEWCLPELLRVRAAVVLQQTNRLSDAEPDLLRSMAIARRQGSLSWEVRTATSLAQIYIEHGQSTLARSILEPVIERFRDGLDSDDLRRAAGVLNAVPRVPTIMRARSSPDSRARL